VTFASLIAPRRCTGRRDECGMARRRIVAVPVHAKCARCRRHASKQSPRPNGTSFSPSQRDVVFPCPNGTSFSPSQRDVVFPVPTGRRFPRPNGTPFSSSQRDAVFLVPTGRHFRRPRTPFHVAGAGGRVPRSNFTQPLRHASPWALRELGAVSLPSPLKLGPPQWPRDAVDRRRGTSFGSQRTVASATGTYRRGQCRWPMQVASASGQYSAPAGGRWWRRA